MFQSYQKWRGKELQKQRSKEAELQMYNTIVDHIIQCTASHTTLASQDTEHLVRTQYTDLCGTEWQIVRESLPDEVLEYQEDAHKLLCGILMVLFQNIELHYGRIKMMLYNKTNLHIDIGEELKDSKNAQTCDKDQITTQNTTEEPGSFQDKVLCSVDTVPLHYFTDTEFNIQQLFEQKYIWQEAIEHLLHNAVLAKFLQKSGRFCWMLVTSDPPFRLTKPYQMYQWKDTHTELVELLDGSDTEVPSGFIQYYGRPVLLRGQRVISKGAVYVNSAGNR